MRQCELILNHMEKYGGITQAEAFNRYGVSRLAARIADLRKEGHVVMMIPTEAKNRYGKKVRFATYRLVGKT